MDYLYAFVQRIMLKQKERWLSKQATESKRYLDFGCGTSAVHHLNTKLGSLWCEPSESSEFFFGYRLFIPQSQALLKNFGVALWHVLGFTQPSFFS